MKKVRGFCKKNKFFLCAMGLLFLLAFLTRTDWNIWGQENFQFDPNSDVDQYYSYLPALSVNGKHNSFDFYGDRGYWLTELPNGKTVPKMTIGMSVFYAPFYYIGHLIALNSDFETTGYSLPYSVSVRIGTWIYVLIGLFFAFKNLTFYLSDKLSAVVIFLIMSATNLWHYTLNEGEMTHAYLFTLFSIFIYTTIKWYKTEKKKFLFFASLVLGFSVLIRPTSVIVLFFLLFYGVYDIHSFKFRGLQIIKDIKWFSIAIIIFFIPLLIQMIFWKLHAENWIVWSYGDENFFFDNPRIADFLFSYRKGWFLYTPLMLVSIIALIYFLFKRKDFSWGVFCILILAVYILSSWWCWWFGGGLGSRSMVEFYAFFILPLGLIIKKLLNSKIKIVKVLSIVFLLLCLGYNLLLERKYPGNLHWDAMSKDAYWVTMKNLWDFDDETEIRFKESLNHPDYDNAKKGFKE